MMTLWFKDTLNPIEGVSLIRSLCVPLSKPFNTDEITLIKDASSPVDKHEVAELWLILSGIGDLSYQGKIHSLKAGDWFYFTPFEEHQIKNKGDGELRILSIYWKSS